MTENPPDDDRTVVRPTQGAAETQQTLKIDSPLSATAAAQAASADAAAAAAPGAPPAPAPAAASSDGGNALAVGTYLGEFELRAVAGEGGFSIVYRAWDHSLNRQVAVKEYMPSGLAQRGTGNMVSVRSERHRETFEAGLRSFVEEARLLAHFDHPALIKVYRFWKANGSAYMVMPFCEGITLRDQWRRSAEPPDETSLLTVLDPLTEALAVLHAEHWYHRDIAPDNVILLAGSNKPLLLDFGAARQVIGDMTHALTVILKPGYAPLEQWGEVPGMKQGPWTDIYALAAMIHFGITGKTPPPSVGRLVNDNYEPLAVVAAGRYSPRFLEAVDRALAVRPENRTRSIDQFRAEIGLGPSAVAGNLTLQLPLGADAAGQATQLLPTQAGAGLGPTQRAAVANDMAPTQRVDAGTYPATQRVMSPMPADPGMATVRAGPAVESRPVAPSSKPRSVLPMVAGGVAVAAAIGVAVVFMGGGGGKTAAPAPVASNVPAPAPASAPAPAPALAPAPAPAPAPFEITRELARVVQQQPPGFAVEATLKRTTLRAEKDELHFTVRSDRDGFVYVYNLGTDGELLQLYPHGKSAPKVRKGQLLSLGEAEKLTVTGPAGPSQLLVMVSALPREHPAFPPSKVVEGYRYYPTGADAAALAARHTGPLPAIAGVPLCPGGNTGCADEFGAALVTFNVVN